MATVRTVNSLRRNDVPPMNRYAFLRTVVLTRTQLTEKDNFMMKHFDSTFRSSAGAVIKQDWHVVRVLILVILDAISVPGIYDTPRRL
jgi:hypothetical protein